MTKISKGIEGEGGKTSPGEGLGSNSEIEFSDYLASIVERKRAEIRDSKPLKDDAGYKSKKKQGEEG